MARRRETPPTTSSNSDTENELEPLAVEILGKWKAGYNYVKDGFFETWDDCWKVYNNERTARANYDAIAETFVPETFTIVESILANVAGGKPQFEFWPTRDDQLGDVKVLNSLAEFYWDQNRLSFKVIPWIRDSIMFGTGILFCYWDNDRFAVRHISLKDFFIDPTARILDDPTDNSRAGYGGFRYLTTKADLEEATYLNPDFDSEQEEGPKNKKVLKLYRNLDEIQPVGTDSTEPTDKEEKDSFLGSTLGEKAKKDQVEVIYFIDRGRLVEMANRKIIIRDETTPFMREESVIESVDDEGNPVPVEIPAIAPFLPFAPLRNYIDSSLFYAKGDIEVIIDEQEHLNDTSNQKADNLALINNKLFALDPAYADKVEEIDSVPGAVFTVPPGALEEIGTSPIGNDADVEMLRTMDSMRRATAADEIIQGASQDKGRITATEIQAQLAQAGTRFAMKLNVLESEGYAALASIMFKLIQINVTQEMAVRKIGPKGVEWQNYNPGEFLGDYEPKVILNTNAQAKREEERQKYVEYFQLASKLPFVNQPALFTKVSEKVFDIDKEDTEALMTQPPSLPAGEDVPGGVTEQDVSPEVLQEIVANAQ